VLHGEVHMVNADVAEWPYNNVVQLFTVTREGGQ